MPSVTKTPVHHVPLETHPLSQPSVTKTPVHHVPLAYTPTLFSAERDQFFLPREVLELIMERMPLPVLLNCLLVCKQWSSLSYDVLQKRKLLLVASEVDATVDIVDITLGSSSTITLQPNDEEMVIIIADACEGCVLVEAFLAEKGSRQFVLWQPFSAGGWRILGSNLKSTSRGFVVPDLESPTRPRILVFGCGLLFKEVHVFEYESEDWNTM